MASSLALTLAVLSWGALAFGAVYPWAYGPLLIACAVIGTVELLNRSPVSRAAVNRRLAIALVVVTAAVGMQLVPLPRATIAKLSPSTDVLLRNYDLRYAVGNLKAGAVFEPEGRGEGRSPREDERANQSAVAHPLSIRPTSTWLGLAFLLALGTFWLGTARALSPKAIRQLVRGLIVLGVLLALVGIIQKATFNGKLYGFWSPQFTGDPFGPFVNRNHFAGWMLMTLPLALGYFCARVARGMSAEQLGWRGRLLWFSSPQANEVALVGFAILVMGLSLLMTVSRSGIACVAVALVLAGWFVARRQAAGSRRTVAAAYLVFLVLVSAGWAGTDAVAARFATVRGSELGGRLGAWRDAMHIIRDFPLTGTGLNTYGTATLFYQTTNLERHYVEAHNDYLQIAAEGGLLVGVPVLLLIMLFVREVRRRFRDGHDDQTTSWIRLGAVTGLVAIGLQEIVEFSLQMPGNAALFAALCAIAVHGSTAYAPRPIEQEMASGSQDDGEDSG